VPVLFIPLRLVLVARALQQQAARAITDKTVFFNHLPLLAVGRAALAVLLQAIVAVLVAAELERPHLELAEQELLVKEIMAVQVLLHPIILVVAAVALAMPVEFLLQTG
jgi:hypothetical protein